MTVLHLPGAFSSNLNSFFGMQTPSPVACSASLSLRERVGVRALRKFFDEHAMSILNPKRANYCANSALESSRARFAWNGIRASRPPLVAPIFAKN
jgi:hypothetical protein